MLRSSSAPSGSTKVDAGCLGLDARLSQHDHQRSLLSRSREQWLLPQRLSPPGTRGLSAKGRRIRAGAAAQLSPLPPLAKGASRHRCPVWTVTRTSAPAEDASDIQTRCDPEVAESFGRKALGNHLWPRRVFEAVDPDCSGFLMPAEFAALVARMQAEMGFAGKRFSFDFAAADADMDGRVSLDEWESFAATMEAALGMSCCKLAAARLLGTRRAEARRRVRNIYMFDGHDADATLGLLMACSKWQSSSLSGSVSFALEQKADPNAGLVDPRFNGYTPLIFLAMAQPTVDGSQVALAVDALLAAKADVHRESGRMPFGRLVPLRFAARLQNHRGLEALLKYVGVGDRFQWAAGENVEHVMLDELRRICDDATCARVAALSRYSTQATILLRIFASPMVGSKLTPDGANKLLTGTFEDGNIRRGSVADPNGPGLEGMTALMEVVRKGDLATTQVLLAGRASPNQQDSSGATPLHMAASRLLPDICRALLQARAEPHVVDHAGFSAWMVVGEECSHMQLDDGRWRHREDGTGDPAAYRELLEMLRPRLTAEQIIEQAEASLQSLMEQEGMSSLEGLAKHLRLQESLFFDPRLIVRSAHEGRAPRQHLLLRVSRLLIKLLTTDPLQNQQKELTKYLLQATMGPQGNAAVAHVHSPWPAHSDNRSAYRTQLLEAVTDMLGRFAVECDGFRGEIELTSRRNPFSGASALCALQPDVVTVPEAWQQADGFWEAVHERQVLRYDPEWARGVQDGASCCLALLRLGAVADLAEYSALRQVHHAPMEELLARGYVTYSNLCNGAFQERIKEVATKIATQAKLDVRPPQGTVGAKNLRRLLEKTREAREERGAMPWPGRSSGYLAFSHCFHILDTVRMSFICGGATPSDQAACCMKLLDGLRACTAEADGICILRQKSGFAAGVKGSGGYADVKLLIFASLGVHRAFDGSEVPLRIVGEVQLILRNYMEVKRRMHLAYEVDRGSFDRRKPSR